MELEENIDLLYEIFQGSQSSGQDEDQDNDDDTVDVVTNNDDPLTELVVEACMLFILFLSSFCFSLTLFWGCHSMLRVLRKGWEKAFLFSSFPLRGFAICWLLSVKVL